MFSKLLSRLTFVSFLFSLCGYWRLKLHITLEASKLFAFFVWVVFPLCFVCGKLGSCTQFNMEPMQGSVDVSVYAC